MDHSNNPEPTPLKFDPFRQWLIESKEDDQWWLCLDDAMEEAPLSLSEVEGRLEAGQYTRELLLHVSQANIEDPAWNEILPHPAQLTPPAVPRFSPEDGNGEPAESLDYKDRPKKAKASSLKNWQEKIPKPPEIVDKNKAPALPKEDKESGKGCLIGILSLIGFIVLLAFWRQIALTVGFFGSWALVAFLGRRAKKSKVASIGGGFLCFLVLNATIENPNVTAADLENPPVALEKIVRKSIASEIVSIKIDTMGPESDKYSVYVEYKSHSMMSDESTLSFIKDRMAQTYKDILGFPELPVWYIKIGAQIDMKDAYGNVGWAEVYRTQLTREIIERINRQNLKDVEFEELFEDVYAHNIFWPYVNNRN